MAAAKLPTGTVTFVLADVEGSVRLWESRPGEMAAATARFDELVSALVHDHNGARPVEQGEGDSFVAAFPVAGDAVDFVVAMQLAVQAADWGQSLPFRVRVAVHTGAVDLKGPGNYMGPTVNRCARIRALAAGGQVLLSAATAELVADHLDHGDRSMRLLDLGVHALRDFERPEHLYQLVHPELPERFPPLSERRELGRLPTVLTSFVARDEEMAAIDALLGRSRLVTLTGAGGSGKTRLALESARARVASCREGVAWADVAPITDGSLVASCIADAFDIREVGSEPLVDTLTRELGTRDVLVVIDNCEHVIDDVARVLEHLFQHCSGLRVLATSREPIGLAGEAAMRVPSLDDAAAVRLFVDRARAARGDFETTPEDDDAVRDVCRRLDGIPLAIELAASRARVLSPRQIADGLADRFRLLTGGGRTALPRQRTLEASVDWSYRLLSEAERRLLERLSVFAGGFTIDAAESVCAEPGVPVLDLLTALVDKSLLQVDEAGVGQEMRYRMLETIRHFARQRLADGADAAAVRDRHLAYVLAEVEEIGPRIEQGDELKWLDGLDADVDNLRAALEWAEESGASELLVRLAAATWLFWEVRCRFEEGCAWLRRAIAASDQPSRARAMALYGLGDMSLFVSDVEQVARSGEEVVEMGEALGDPAVVARGTALLGWAACFHVYRSPTWAVDALEVLLDQLSEHDEPWLHCDAGIARGLACVAAGDLKAAAPSFDRALACATRSRSIASMQRAAFFRGWCHALAYEVTEADVLLGRAVDLAGVLGDTFMQALTMGITAYVRFVEGDLYGAVTVAQEARSLGERYLNDYALVVAEDVLALVGLARGDLEGARASLARARPIAAAMGLDWVGAWSEAPAALVEAASGAVDAARATLAAASSAIGRGPYTQAVLAVYSAWTERLGGDDAAAEAAASEALAASTASGARGLASAALDELAVSAARREQFERAARLFGAAEAERGRLGIAPARWPVLPAYDEEVAAVRLALGDDGFAAEWDAGASTTLDEAARFGLRGKGGRRRPRSGWDSLTPTELEVVRLVRDGLTNPVIAEKLLVTRGTVKVHLSHVFTKLGVASRAELAAEAARRGLS